MVRIEVQFRGRNITDEEIRKMVYEDLEGKNTEGQNVEDLRIYYIPEEASVYYVAELSNGESIGTGNVPIYIG